MLVQLLVKSFFPTWPWIMVLTMCACGKAEKKRRVSEWKENNGKEVAHWSSHFPCLCWNQSGELSMLGQCWRWEARIPCTMQWGFSCFACLLRNKKGLGASWRSQRQAKLTHRWRYCTSYFPSTSLPGNGSSSVGVSTVLLGFVRDMCTPSSMERTSSRSRVSAMRASVVTTKNVSLVQMVPSDWGQIRPHPPAPKSPSLIVHLWTTDGRAENGLVSEWIHEPSKGAVEKSGGCKKGWLGDGL